MPRHHAREISTAGALPLHPARGIMPLDPEFLIILRRRPRVKPQPSAHCYIKVWASVPEHDGSLSETKLRAAHPSVHRRCNRLLNAAAIRGPRRKYFRWGKDLRPRKLDGKLSRHGLGARRVALLAPRGVLSKCHIRLIIWVRSPKFWQSSKVSPAFWETANLFRVGEECRRRGGGLLLPCRGTAACLFPRARCTLRASTRETNSLTEHP